MIEIYPKLPNVVQGVPTKMRHLLSFPLDILVPVIIIKSYEKPF
jgi:hypothetical protein